MEDQCRYYSQRDPDVREAVIALEVAICRFNMAEDRGAIDEACRSINEAERRLKAAIQRAREVRNLFFDHGIGKCNLCYQSIKGCSKWLQENQQAND